MTAAGGNAEQLWSAVRGLQADYPDWRIGTIQCHDGRRLDAHRAADEGNLVAVITDDPDELRAELDIAASRELEGGSGPPGCDSPPS